MPAGGPSWTRTTGNVGSSTSRTLSTTSFAPAAEEVPSGAKPRRSPPPTAPAPPSEAVGRGCRRPVRVSRAPTRPRGSPAPRAARVRARASADSARELRRTRGAGGRGTRPTPGWTAPGSVGTGRWRRCGAGRPDRRGPAPRPSGRGVGRPGRSVGGRSPPVLRPLQKVPERSEAQHEELGTGTGEPPRPGLRPIDPESAQELFREPDLPDQSWSGTGLQVALVERRPIDGAHRSGRVLDRVPRDGIHGESFEGAAQVGVFRVASFGPLEQVPRERHPLAFERHAVERGWEQEEEVDVESVGEEGSAGRAPRHEAAGDRELLPAGRFRCLLGEVRARLGDPFQELGGR